MSHKPLQKHIVVSLRPLSAATPAWLAGPSAPPCSYFGAIRTRRHNLHSVLKSTVTTMTTVTVNTC